MQAHAFLQEKLTEHLELHIFSLFHYDSFTLYCNILNTRFFSTISDTIETEKCKCTEENPHSCYFSVFSMYHVQPDRTAALNSCQSWVWRKGETSTPVSKLYCTVLHLVECSLHPDSSSVYQKSSLMSRQTEALLYVPDSSRRPVVYPLYLLTDLSLSH